MIMKKKYSSSKKKNFCGIKKWRCFNWNRGGPWKVYSSLALASTSSYFTSRCQTASGWKKTLKNRLSQVDVVTGRNFVHFRSFLGVIMGHLPQIVPYFGGQRPWPNASRHHPATGSCSGTGGKRRSRRWKRRLILTRCFPVVGIVANFEQKLTLATSFLKNGGRTHPKNSLLWLDLQLGISHRKVLFDTTNKTVSHMLVLSSDGLPQQQLLFLFDSTGQQRPFAKSSPRSSNLHHSDIISPSISTELSSQHTVSFESARVVASWWSVAIHKKCCLRCFTAKNDDDEHQHPPFEVSFSSTACLFAPEVLAEVLRVDHRN